MNKIVMMDTTASHDEWLQPRRKSRRRDKPDRPIAVSAPIMQTRLRRHRLAVVLWYRPPNKNGVELSLLRAPLELIRPYEVRVKRRSDPAIGYEFETLEAAMDFCRSKRLKLELCRDVSDDAIADYSKKNEKRRKRYAEGRN